MAQLRKHTRRTFLKINGAALATLSGTASTARDLTKRIEIDPKPRHDLSPYLYMQFMEPLGTTDGSVSAAWDYRRDGWRQDVINITKELAPSLIRWGGNFSAYYRWKEAVGPREHRKPMLNICWGGIEPNQVGTAEFMDFCRQVGAEALMCVNFESDGKEVWSRTPKGEERWAGADEAAEWVDYCNNPTNSLRIQHGFQKPLGLKLWQIGNETSYGKGFSLDTAIRKTIQFAKAMRKVDPDIELIGWGDNNWAKPMIEGAGEYLNYIAFHHMFNPDTKDDPTLRVNEFRKDPARTWDVLMRAYSIHERKIKQIYDQTSGYGIPLALTECHYTIPGRNRCEVLSTWAAGVSYARLLNVHERYGDRLKIATSADFCGTRWMVNAVMIPVPGGNSFMMPVARVMSLYRKHSGEKYIAVNQSPGDLDVTASRTGNRVFLHVVNTNRTEPVRCRFIIQNEDIQSARVYEIAADPEFEVTQFEPDRIAPKRKDLPDTTEWICPAASVSAVELLIA